MALSKFGFLYVYEVNNAVLLHKTKVSDGAIFVGAVDSVGDGLYGINK